MRLSLIVAALPALLACNVAVAQVGGMALVPTPTVGATSPLGGEFGSPIAPTGIPLGATEITSPGTSPLPSNPTGTIAMPSSSGTPCSTLGSSSSAMYGSTATYDGGGMSAAASMPATGGAAGNTAAAASMSSSLSTTSGLSATSGMMQSSGMSTASGIMDTAGMSGMCGSGSNSVAASSTPTTPTTPGGAARVGVPLGSVEIGNLGVSSAATVPTPFVTTMNAAVPTIPATPVVTSPPPVPTGSTTTTSGTFSPTAALGPAL